MEENCFFDKPWKYHTRESTKNVQHTHLPSALVSRALKAASADALSLSANILTLVSK